MPESAGNAMLGLPVRGLDMPSVLYGTAWKEDRTRELTQLALKHGFRGIDTANQRRHYVEAAVGEAVDAAIRQGTVRREELFLQTKFTYLGGQDHRLPYDAGADVVTQVNQSMESSLAHLRTDSVDSYVLHGPASPAGWSPIDGAAWNVMVALQAAGKTRLLGLSNVSLRHLGGLLDSGARLPDLVQNRCFARTGWDAHVRTFCREHRIAYQAFSLLTANREELLDPLIIRISGRLGATPAQVIFRFARQVGMLVLTGTSNATHMEQDLLCDSFDLTGDELCSIETMAL